MNTNSSDRELLPLVGSDPVAFEVFYRRHIDLVIRFTAKRVREPADVADIVSSTFLTVISASAKYDPERGEPTAWLLGIAARLIANSSRRRGRELSAIGKFAGRQFIDANDIERLEEKIDATNRRAEVDEAMAELNPRSREALLLVGDDGLTPSQAARVVGVSAAAFRMRLTVARRALDALISKRDRAPGVPAPSPTSPMSTFPNPPTTINLNEVKL